MINSIEIPNDEELNSLYGEVNLSGISFHLKYFYSLKNQKININFKIINKYFNSLKRIGKNIGDEEIKNIIEQLKSKTSLKSLNLEGKLYINLND